MQKKYEVAVRGADGEITTFPILADAMELTTYGMVFKNKQGSTVAQVPQYVWVKEYIEDE